MSTAIADMKRSRMIFDLPEQIRMAIKLAAVKHGTTTGKIVEIGILSAYLDEVTEAVKVIKRKEKP